jgi:hypothetical protein
VINFMRLRLARDAIDRPLNNEIMFIPFPRPKGFAKSLRSLRFAAARPDNLLDWDRRYDEYVLKYLGGLGEVDLQDRLCMGAKI